MKKYYDAAALAVHKRSFMRWVEAINSIGTAWAYEHAASALQDVYADEPVYRTARDNGTLPELCKQRGTARAIADIQQVADGSAVEITAADHAAAEFTAPIPPPPDLEELLSELLGA